MNIRFQAVVNLQVILQPMLWDVLYAQAVETDRTAPMDYQVLINRQGALYNKRIGFLYFDERGQINASFAENIDRKLMAQIVDLLPELNKLDILGKLQGKS